jgi:hypothetical protein
VGKLEKRSPGTLRRRKDDSVRTDFREIATRLGDGWGWLRMVPKRALVFMALTLHMLLTYIANFIVRGL